jgi:hypothetical protein
LPVDVKFNVILGILSGLCPLNDNGLQHGHLRPGSIPLGAFGHPLLLGYGLAPLRRCRVSESDDFAAFMGLLGQLVGSQPAISGKWSTALEAFGWFAGPEGRSWLARTGMGMPALVARQVPSRQVPSRQVLVEHLMHIATLSIPSDPNCPANREPTSTRANRGICAL